MDTKLREALRQVSRVAVEMTRKTITGEPEDRKTIDRWALRLCDIASEALLAEPIRNCDIGTVEEQAERFDEFCYNHRSREKGCGDCPLLGGGPCCELAWTQMPYEAGGEKC